MSAKLIVMQGKNYGLTCHLPDKEGDIFIGSDEICELTLKNDPLLARLHCRIRKRGLAYFLEDMGTKAGVYLEQVQITKPVRLHDGMQFRVGDNTIVFYEEPGRRAGNPLHKTKPLRKIKRPQVTLGHYRLLERIDAGSFSTIYKARDTQSGRIVALKILSRRARQMPQVVARFCREAFVYAKLQHPNIIKIYNIDRHHDNLYLVLEYIDGLNLGKLVSLNGPLSPKHALQLGLAASQALAYAQKAGIYHRDLKPANMLIERQTKRLKIADMGIAKLADESGLTRPGELLGTPIYMAPEQIIASGRADHRADIYSLGATLYFVLSGQPPFQWDPSMKLQLFMQQRLKTQPPSLQKIRPDLPRPVVTLIERTMASQVEQRFQSYPQLHRAFRKTLRWLVKG